MPDKIAGGTADQRTEMSAELAERQAAAAAHALEASQQAQEAEAKRVMDAAAMAAVERLEAERLEQVAAAEAAQERDAAKAADPTAAARQLLAEAEELRAKAEDERARLAKLGDDYEIRLRRERDRDRVNALRSMGAMAGVSDVQLLMISPDVDPDSPGGKAELDSWRESNAGLFIAPTVPRMPSAEEMLGTLTRKQSANGFYNAKYFAEIMARNLARQK